MAPAAWQEAHSVCELPEATRSPHLNLTKPRRRRWRCMRCSWR